VSPDHLRRQAEAGVELKMSARRPIDGLGDARRLVEVLVAQRLHENAPPVATSFAEIAGARGPLTMASSPPRPGDSRPSDRGSGASARRGFRGFGSR